MKTLRVLCALLAGMIVILFGIPLQGEGASDIDNRLTREEARMRALENQIAEHRQRVRQMGEREQGILSRVDELNRKRNAVEQRIRVLQLREEKTQQSMAELRKEIEAAERELATMKKVLEERLINIYKYGGVAEFNLLLSATTAHEAMETTLLLNRIALQDEAMINDMLLKKDRLDEAVEELQEERRKLAANSAALEQSRRTYREELAKSNDFLQKVQKERSMHQQAVKELEDSQREIQRTIMALMQRKREAEERRRREEEERRRREEEERRRGRPPVERPEPPPPPQYTYLPSDGRLAWPVQGEITSPFGMRVHPVFKTRLMHTGIDIRAPSGTPVHAAGPGEVIFAGWLRGYGQIVIIDHGNDLSSVYAHLSTIAVGDGDAVRAGQNIGAVGSTGTATGAHLHFEVRVNGEARDPMRYLGRR